MKYSDSLMSIANYLLTLCNFQLNNMEGDLNRLKVVLAEKKKTSKWLAEQLGKDPATVSKWCTNSSQPSLGTLREIADLLDMDMRELINSQRVEEPGVVYMKFRRD